MEDLAVCAIFKNEALYLNEWLSYHYAQGVRKFILYDNSSTDDSCLVIKHWSHSSIVEVIDWPFKGGQVSAYADMVRRYKDAAEWCAFIDCDEFLCPQSNLSLVDILRGVERDANGLYVHWWMFGSSGHVARSPGLVTETFVWRAPDDFGSHYFGKSIMRLRAITQAGLHTFCCEGKMINDSGWEVDQTLSTGQLQKSHRLVALNHYFTKSRDEWQIRRALGKADKLEADQGFYREEDEFNQHDRNVIRDDRAALFMQSARAMFYSPLRAPPTFTLPFQAHFKTMHDTFLCWDELTSEVKHCSAEQLSSRLVPLCVAFVDAERTSIQFVNQNTSGDVVSIDGETDFTVVPEGNGPRFHLVANGLFLSAEVDSGNVRANRHDALLWETFVALSPQHQAS